MRLTELLNKENVTISCELFPPKQGAQLDNYKKIVGDVPVPEYDSHFALHLQVLPYNQKFRRLHHK